MERPSGAASPGAAIPIQRSGRVQLRFHTLNLLPYSLRPCKGRFVRWLLRLIHDFARFRDGNGFNVGGSYVYADSIGVGGCGSWSLVMDALATGH